MSVRTPMATPRCCPISFIRSERGAITTRIGSPSSHNSMTELVQELDGFGVKQESPKVRTAFTPRREARAAHRLRDERTGPAMVGHGPRADAPRAGLPRDPRTLRRRDETVGALFPARGTRSHRGDLADATHRDRAAGDFRHAGLAGGAVEVVGHRSPRRSSGTASERSPRLASPACSVWKKPRGSSCSGRASWTAARAAKAPCSPWVWAKMKRVR